MRKHETLVLPHPSPSSPTLSALFHSPFHFSRAPRFAFVRTEPVFSFPDLRRSFGVHFSFFFFFQARVPPLLFSFVSHLTRADARRARRLIPARRCFVLDFYFHYRALVTVERATRVNYLTRTRDIVSPAEISSTGHFGSPVLYRAV